MDMPFVKVDIDSEIEKIRNAEPEFKKAWDDSRMEYKLLGELVRLRKETGLTQKELAEKTGKKQQTISKIEKHEKSPTLATLCNLANALNVDITLVPRNSPRI
jgi:DNA-binding XRE family transcriptional regulator